MRRRRHEVSLCDRKHAEVDEEHVLRRLGRLLGRRRKRHVGQVCEEEDVVRRASGNTG